jgi:hypothetical protein
MKFTRPISAAVPGAIRGIDEVEARGESGPVASESPPIRICSADAFELPFADLTNGS